MGKNTVTGNAEDLKKLKNGKNAPEMPLGGPASKTNRNGQSISNGYIDQGPVLSDLSENHGVQFVNGGPKRK